MSWQRWITLVGLLAALVALAAWQWDEYGHECDSARQVVSNASESVMNVLVGGIRSHRRLGPSFADSVQDVLDSLVQSKDVRAVALVSLEDHKTLSAGDQKLLNLKPPLTPGESWSEAGLESVRTFSLPTETSGPGSGRGPAAGGGRGRGWRVPQEDTHATGSFAPGKTVAAVLLVDRERVDRACQNAAWLRGSIVAAGWLVLACVALAWRATVRLAEARGRQRLLETQSRHFRDLSQAAAGLAHETRNPLGLIRGWTQRLADVGANTLEGRLQAQAIIEECDRVTARINQFLAFARPSEPQLESFDASAVARELAVLLDPDVSAKRVTIEPLAEGAVITADREMFRQALFNLLQNAVQASPEGETVRITISRRAGGTSRLDVSDRGPGVPPDAVPKLFTPYFAVRKGGTGLGLAIVRSIAAAHGWEVGYAPREGGGAVFWLDGIHG